MGNRFGATLTLREGFAFELDFGDGSNPIIVDEPPPLGEGRGPNAARLLAGAIGNCLSASLLFCLYKARIDVAGMQTTVEGEIARNPAGRLRIGEVRVRLAPTVAAEDVERIDRCLGLFEDFCTVTASVREGMGVSVEVAPVTVEAPQPVG